MLAPIDLAGRTAVVTGAARGIGRAIAGRLAEEGSHVVALDKDGGMLAEAFPGRECAVVEGDLTADARSLAETILEEHGPVELVVNNAGMETDNSFFELEEQSFDLVFGTNLRGPWFFTRRLMEELVSAGRPGAVVFVSSLHDTFIYRRPHYSTSKAAVAMLTKELAYELGPNRIRVNAISPGGIRTDAADARDLYQPTIPLGRAGSPDDVARMAVILLSDECAGYVSGANLPVDGGAGLPDIWSTTRR